MMISEKEQKIKEIREYAESIHSPLSTRDIGLLISYGQTGTELPIDDYLKIWHHWLEINDGQIEYI